MLMDSRFPNAISTHTIPKSLKMHRGWTLAVRYVKQGPCKQTSQHSRPQNANFWDKKKTQTEFSKGVDFVLI